MYDKLSCLNIKEITPLEHQKKICKFLLNDANRGLLVFHSVGSGKTITSLLTAKCLLKKYPNKKVIVLTGTSLVSNFQKEVKKLNLQKDERIIITSYGVFVNRLKLKAQNDICKDTILIIDEAQNFGRKGVKSTALIGCASKAFKVLLLTGTPVNNRPEEIINLMAMIMGKKVSLVSNEISRALIDPKGASFKNIFGCRVSIYNANDPKYFPSFKEHVVKLIMSKEYYTEYYKIQEDIKEDLPEIFINTKNLTVFMNGARRAVNKTKQVSPKIIWTIEKTLKDVARNKKVLIYSSWKQAGINIIKEILQEHNISYSEVSGELDKNARKKAVDLYNNNVNKVIIITAAGAEGLDLKATRSIIIIDPHWNEARTNQIIGRGIRYGSHIGLPAKERRVDIYHLLLKKPEQRFKDDTVPSTDIILRDMSLHKSGEIISFYKNLEPLSIENNKKCKI